MSDNRHENYDILNFDRLWEFDVEFVQAFGFGTKTAFYKNMISKGVADTIDTIKNRQDLSDPFF